MRILKQTVLYFSPTQQARANAYLKKAEQAETPVHEMALDLMDALGGHELECLAKETRELLPYFETLSACVKAYEANQTDPITIENAVLACRGLPLAAGPSMISELTSPLRDEFLMQKTEQLEDAPRPQL